MQIQNGTKVATRLKVYAYYYKLFQKSFKLATAIVDTVHISRRLYSQGHYTAYSLSNSLANPEKGMFAMQPH